MHRQLAFVLLVTLALQVDARELALPFAGRWFVAQGGDTPNVNHHMSVRAQWYGVDFAKAGGPHGRSLTSIERPARVEQFYAWGETVLAPVDGTVVSVVNERPDNALGAKDQAHPAGNHVVIDAGGDVYVFLAHLQQHSIVVEAGARVTQGQAIGKVGNSGNSDFPHLHLHLQDDPSPDQGKGLNPIFAGIDVELTGKTFRNVRWPLIRGLFVTSR